MAGLLLHIWLRSRVRMAGERSRWWLKNSIWISSKKSLLFTFKPLSTCGINSQRMAGFTEHTSYSPGAKSADDSDVRLQRWWLPQGPHPWGARLGVTEVSSFLTLVSVCTHFLHSLAELPTSPLPGNSHFPSLPFPHPGHPSSRPHGKCKPTEQ